ncbi:MAG: hypothetical protein NVSMB3_14610 [Acidobacteriaceae bacterium]
MQWSYISMRDGKSVRCKDREAQRACARVVVPASGDGGVTPTAVEAAALWAEFQRARFFSLDSEYVEEVTDCPTFTLELSYDGLSKEVVDYMGLEVGMPFSVTKLEQKVDRVAGTASATSPSKRSRAPVH